MINEVRMPKQKRSIEKRKKIIDAGWKLISQNGYYNTNTQEIASLAGVSTGIVYQYFKDKHDILLAGIEAYADDVFFPILKDDFENVKIDDFKSFIKNIIEEYINEHKLSKSAHEEIMAMVHTDEDVSKYYYEREMTITNKICDLLIHNDMKIDNIEEKVHIMVGLIDNLCHEVVYHKHDGLDYKAMSEIVIENIINIINLKK